MPQPWIIESNELETFADEVVEVNEIDLQRAELRSAHSWAKYLPNRASSWRKKGKIKWWIENVITEGQIGVLSGKSGVGKTFVTLELIFSLGLQRDFAGFRNVAEKPIKTYYIAGEGVASVGERLNAMCQYYEVSDETLDSFLAVSDTMIVVDNDLNVAEFIKAQQMDFKLTGINFGVIVIDTMIYCEGGFDENNANHMGQLLSRFQNIQKMYDGTGLEKPTVLFLTHPPKGGGSEIRGSGTIHGNLELVLRCEYDKSTKIGTLSNPKNKARTEFEPVKYKLMPFDEDQAILTFLTGVNEPFDRDNFCLQKVAESCKKLQPDEWKKPGFFTKAIKDEWPIKEIFPEDDYFSRFYKRLASTTGDNDKMLLVRKDKQAEYAVNPKYTGFIADSPEKMNDEDE